MPDNRYFLESPLSEGSRLSLTGDEFHHLSRVMRLEPGESLELVNGSGTLAQATLLRLTRSEAEIEIVQSIHSPEPPPLILAQGMTLPSPLEWIIEKGTELGATAFWLFPGQRSEKRQLSDNQRRRLRQITISALKQCGRLYLPSILEFPPLSRWKSPPAGDSFFGDLQSRTPPSPSLHQPRTIFIGPESGFSPEEIDLLRNKFHAKGIRLHPNILRAETAALCALALLSQ